MKQIKYSNPNDECLGDRLSDFVKSHGGKWVVIAGGKVIGFADKEGLSRVVKRARKRFPGDTPLISPIPREEELEWIWESFWGPTREPPVNPGQA